MLYIVAMDEPRPLRSLSPFVLLGFPLWAVVYVVSRAWLEIGTAPASTAAQWWIAMAPLPPFLLLLHGVVQDLRRLDELQRRVRQDALVGTFLFVLVAVFVLGQCEIVPGFDHGSFGFRMLFPLLAFVYSVNLLRAQQRYRRG
jgi:hypothetical protein